MSVESVGIENLPNVFIDEIFIYSNSNSSANVGEERIVVRLGMYDHYPNPSWRRAEMSGLRVKIMFISGRRNETQDTIDKINDGKLSLYQYDSNNLNSDGHGTHVIILSVQDFVRSGDGDTEGYQKFKKTIEVAMKHPENLNVYAACFVGDLNLGSDLLNKFYGPMAGEKIYVGGIVNEESSYFYFADTNEEYGGPVHGHQETWMVGSQHSDQPHKTLRRVSEQNYKIKVISGIVDPNEMLPDEPGPQSAAGNEWEREALAGINQGFSQDMINTDPLEEIGDGPDDGGPGPVEDPDLNSGGY